MHRTALGLSCVVALVAAASTGCSSDTTAADFGGDPTTGAPVEDGGPAAGDGTDGNAAEGGALEDGTGDDGGDEGDSGGTGFGPDAACDLDCGEGSCDIGADGLPACACPEGSVSVGLTCLPCTPTSGAADVDIGGVSVSARVLIDHEPAPGDDYEDGELWLRDDVGGDEVLLGNSHDDQLGAMVLPGTYDLVWSVESGGTQVPSNTRAVLGRIQVRDGEIRLGTEGRAELTLEGGVLLVDIPTVVAVGEFLLDGETPPGDGYENATITLVDPASSDAVELGELRDGDFSVRVIAGTYQVRYSALVSNGAAPLNHDAILGTIDVVGAEVAPEHTIDVPVATFTGDFLFDGMPASTSIYEQGRVVLTDAATGDEIELGKTSDASFSVPVIPGSYDVVYSHVIGQTLPGNTRAHVGTIAIAAADPPTDVDIETTTVAGAITVGGGPAPADPGNVGVVTLRGIEGDDEVVLGTTNSGSYAALVVAGTYDVFYRQQTSAGGVPLNTNARVSSASVTLPGGSLGDIDVPFVAVSGVVTLDGATPPTSEYDDGRIYLRNLETDDSVLLGNTRMGEIDGLVVPGTYDVVYVVETAGATVPQNSGAVLTTLEVPAGGGAISVPIDIPVGTLSGAITSFGGAIPGGDADRANLVLEDRTTDDFVFLGPISAGNFSAPVAAGTYVVWYEMTQTTGQIPANKHAGLACFTLSP
jgi:hypothetical protein